MSDWIQSDSEDSNGDSSGTNSRQNFHFLPAEFFPAPFSAFYINEKKIWDSRIIQHQTKVNKMTLKGQTPSKPAQTTTTVIGVIILKIKTKAKDKITKIITREEDPITQKTRARGQNLHHKMTQVFFRPKQILSC